MHDKTPNFLLPFIRDHGADSLRMNREAMVTSTVSDRLFKRHFLHYLLVSVLESIRNSFYFYYATKRKSCLIKFTSPCCIHFKPLADFALPCVDGPCRLSRGPSCTGQQTIYSRCRYARNSEDADRERVQRGVKRVVIKEVVMGIYLTNAYQPRRLVLLAGYQRAEPTRGETGPFMPRK